MGLIFENKGLIFEGMGLIFENKELIFENKELIFENKELIFENKELIFENRELIFEDKLLILEFNGSNLKNKLARAMLFSNCSVSRRNGVAREQDSGRSRHPSDASLEGKDLELETWSKRQGSRNI